MADPTALRPTLVGQRVVLRPIRAGDTDAMFAAVQDPEGLRLTGTTRRFTRDEIATHIAWVMQADDRVDLVITRPGDDRFVGEAVLNDIDWHNRSANFRIMLAGPALFGQGLGGEATRLVVAHGFAALDLHRIELEVLDFNPRARRAYERAGFVVEGVKRDALWSGGAWHDSIVMGLLQPDWRRGQGAAA
jgi:RimJ/RimL family protein N-acetyltransferase